MLHRPRILAALPVVLVLATSGCSLEVHYEGSHYSCADDQKCPDGYECVADFCEPVADGIDAAPGADGEPDAALGDDAASLPPDAMPSGTPDAGPPPCTGLDTVEDPGTGHCYRLIRPSLSFLDANAGCQLLGFSHLAVITSSQENAVIESLDDGTVFLAWTGGTDAVVENTFKWVTGQTFSYTNWNAGEPNNYNGVEDCSVIRLGGGGTWDDRECTIGYSSICERD